MKAIDAVANLRALADLLEKHGQSEIRMSSATIWFDDKDSFLEISRDFPRPSRKGYEESAFGNFKLVHGELTKTGYIELSIPRSSICELVAPARPAEYRCKPIFSDEEEKEMGQA